MATPAPASTTSPLRVLGHPSYRYLWTGSVVASLGTAIGGVVLLWAVFSTTGSPLDVALLGVVGFLPTVVFGILAGALIDRTDRRRLMIACDLGRLVALGLLAGYTLLAGVNLVAILAAAFVVATFSAVFRPTTNAVIPALLGATEMTDGNGLLLAGTTVGGFVGSPIGGILILAIGVVGGLAVNAVAFGFSAAMISLMVIPMAHRESTRTDGGRPSLLSDVGEGLRYLRSQRVLLAATLGGMAANFFIAIFGQFLVVYATVQLHAGATGFGLLVAASFGSFGLGGLLAGRVGADRAPGVWYPATWAIGTACIVGVGLVSNLPAAVILTLGFGVFGGIGNTTFLSAVMRTVPPSMLGRYFATDEAGSFAMIPAGQIAGGFLILAIGVSATFVIAGVAGFVASAFLLLFPSVRAWGRPGSATASGAPAGPALER